MKVIKLKKLIEDNNMETMRTELDDDGGQEWNDVDLAKLKIHNGYPDNYNSALVLLNNDGIKLNDAYMNALKNAFKTKYATSIANFIENKNYNGLKNLIDKIDKNPQIISGPQQKFDIKNMSVGDLKIEYDNAKNIDQKGTVVKNALNKFTPNTNAGTIIGTLYGNNKDYFEELSLNEAKEELTGGENFLCKFINAFKWDELNKNNTFIKFLNSKPFKETFTMDTVKNHSKRIRLSTAGFDGETMGPREVFEAIYKAYVDDKLDKYADNFDNMSIDDIALIAFGSNKNSEAEQQQSIKNITNSIKNEDDVKNLLKSFNKDNRNVMYNILKKEFEK